MVLLQNPHRLRAFTLIELLVVVTIIAILVALLFPAIDTMRKASYVAPCMNHQRQIVAALLTYAADHQGRLPDIAVEAGGGDSERWDVKIAEYLNMPHAKFYGANANSLRCPSAKKGTWFTYGLPYAGGDRRVFARRAQSFDPPAGNPNNKGSARLVNLPTSTILIADAYDPNNITSDLFYSPWGNYPLTTDQDGDGVNDSSGNLPPPRKFNCIDPRHGNGKAFIGGAVDGSVRLITIREWAENPKYWGPEY
jgi:prepilin-type N-terminal cleavage/methylation domain-containing protein